MKTALVIDGNWLLLSRALVQKNIMKGFEVGSDDETFERTKEVLSDFMIRSIDLVCKRLDKLNIDDIIITKDGHSWRKTLDNPFDVSYKGNRDYDIKREYRFDKIMEALDVAGEKLSEKGFKFIKGKHIEGDDIIYKCKEILLSNNINCIIWSQDADLKQLVENRNNVLCTWFNGNKFVLQSQERESEDLLQMMVQMSNYNDFESNLNFVHLDVEYINSKEIILQKIFCGDVSDNIQSVAVYNTNKKCMKLTWKKVLPILEKLQVSTAEDTKNKIEDIIIELKKIPKYDFSNIKDKILFNRRLVWLDTSQYTQQAIEEWNSIDLELSRKHDKPKHALNTIEDVEKDIMKIFS